MGLRAPSVWLLSAFTSMSQLFPPFLFFYQGNRGSCHVMAGNADTHAYRIAVLMSLGKSRLCRHFFVSNPYMLRGVYAAFNTKFPCGSDKLWHAKGSWQTVTFRHDFTDTTVRYQGTRSRLLDSTMSHFMSLQRIPVTQLSIKLTYVTCPRRHDCLWNQFRNCSNNEKRGLRWRPATIWTLFISMYILGKGMKLFLKFILLYVL
jgi:hypothetical protein